MNLDLNRLRELFAALADRTRLRIAHLLLRCENGLCVCELTDALEEPQPNVSRHLKLMKQAGLVKERREGRWTYCCLCEPVRNFLLTLSCCFEELPATELVRDQHELRKRLALRRRGKCVVGIQKPALR
ncbi:MAG: winged helix-turn-helix transcriptional regulator [Acidobacteria bacterium]|nr:winged helix-turn-helix transcriptional regulator [Acidobacteriota bacterium]